MASADRPAFASLRGLQISYRSQVLEEIKGLLRCWSDRGGTNKELGLVAVPDEIKQDLQASYPDVKLSSG